MKTSTAIVIVLCLAVSIAAQQQPAPAARGGGGRGAAIDPRVLLFEARPSTIRPGESAQLVWQTEATRNLSIDQGIGPVEVRGSKQVTPSQTTTYTLQVSPTLSKSVTVTVTGAPVARSTTATSAGGNAGRINGHPDFSGVYGSAGLPANAQPPA